MTITNLKFWGARAFWGALLIVIGIQLISNIIKITEGI